MTPDQTSAYIEQVAPEYGVDPAIAMSLAEMTSYSPKWSSPNRSGILQLPNQFISDIAVFQKNPEAQIDAGLMALAQAKKDAPNDFAMLASYTGSPATALKALLRTMKYRNQAITPEELTASVEALGLDLDPAAEARKAGVRVEAKQLNSQADPVAQAMQPDQQPMQATQQPMQQPEPMPEPDPMDMVATSSAKDKKRRIDAAFGDNSIDGDIPEDLIAYVKGMIQ